MSSLRFDLKKTKRKDVEGFLLGVYTASFLRLEGRTLQGSGFIPDSFVTGEARNVKKGDQLICCFLMPSLRRLRGSNQCARVVLPKEGAVYELSGFDVSRSNPNYRLSDSPFSVQFTDLTSFVELSNPAKPIRIEHLRLRNYDQLMVVANTNTDLPGKFPLPE
ncbi:hypothetical protein DY000_02061524 [Brassica cretica]|uniref:Uncharacterized protein n=1 Tax=Brassica cretica TaxID=69181 RepID=A0ABQ7B196_BRACR|nr:hypothetical protein DY000_02061524 [Brassica cretica]